MKGGKGSGLGGSRLRAHVSGSSQCRCVSWEAAPEARAWGGGAQGQGSREFANTRTVEGLGFIGFTFASLVALSHPFPQLRSYLRPHPTGHEPAGIASS